MNSSTGRNNPTPTVITNEQFQTVYNNHPGMTREVINEFKDTSFHGISKPDKVKIDVITTYEGTPHSEEITDDMVFISMEKANYGRYRGNVIDWLARDGNKFLTLLSQHLPPFYDKTIQRIESGELDIDTRFKELCTKFVGDDQVKNLVSQLQPEEKITAKKQGNLMIKK